MNRDQIEWMEARFHGLSPLLQVFDMRTSIAFYCGMLGFELVSRSSEGDDFDWCLLSGGGAEIMLNTMYEAPDRPSSPDAKRTEHHSDVCLYFGCQDLDSVYAHLRAHGVAVEPPKVAPYGMRQLPFLDPDGYALCFQWPAA